MVLSRKSKEGSNGDIPLSNGITSINSLNASLESSASHSPQDGCLVLGEKAGRGNKYVSDFCFMLNQQLSLQHPAQDSVLFVLSYSPWTASDRWPYRNFL